MYDANDILLHVISAKREMSWTEYKKIYDDLYTAYVIPERAEETNINFTRSQTVRSLDALGHCEVQFSNDDQKIFSAPSILARLPRIGIPTAALVGARFPRTVMRLKDAAKKMGRGIKVSLQKQPNGYIFAPRGVLVETEYADDLSELAKLLNLQFENDPPAWSVINFSASLDEYLTTRRWSRRGELNWQRKDFSFSSLSYTREQCSDREVRLSRYVDPVRNLNLHLFWKGEECTEIDSDWGRYAALREVGINVLAYDSEQFTLRVPSTVPLPRLIARGLTLCSGQLPRVVEFSGNTSPNRYRSTTVYDDIPPPIAELAVTKVGQRIATTGLDSTLEGVVNE